MKSTKKSLAEFIKAATQQLTAKVKEVMSPLYEPGETSSLLKSARKALMGWGKTPHKAQKDIISALIKGYSNGRKTLGLIGEMGTGKTLMGIFTAIALTKFFRRPIRVLVTAPSTPLATWFEDLQDILGDEVKIVDCTGSDTLRLLNEAKKNRKKKPPKTEFWLFSLDKAKRSVQTENVFFTNYKYEVTNSSLTNVEVSKKKRFMCERCCTEIEGDDLVFTRKMRCKECGEPFWAPKGNPADKALGKFIQGESLADRKVKKRAWSSTKFIKKYLRGYFDLFIADEVHCMKGGNTEQGVILGQLAEVCKKTLVLTGTLSGGKASDIYYLLMRVFALNYRKAERTELLAEIKGPTSFIRQFGTMEDIRKVWPDYHPDGKDKVRSNSREKAGISPLALRQFFIENCVFIRLSDIADLLPNYREELEFVDLPQIQKDVYDAFEQELKVAAQEALDNKDISVLSRMLSTLLAWSDCPGRDVEVANKVGDVVASADALPIVETNKDARVVELLKDMQAAGRKVLIYAEYTGKWEADNQVANMLRAHGFNPLVMKSNIPSGKRLQWIREQMATANYDCLICQPRLVEMGLNLREFPEVWFYQTGYSTYTLRQAARRSYRPGQKQDVVVRYFINRGTMQERAMEFIASKLEAALVLEGELSDKGLVALSEAGDSIVFELARALVDDLESEGLEAQFASYKKSEATADSFVGDESTVEVETTTTTTVKAGNSKQIYTVRSRQTRHVGELVGDQNGRRIGKIFNRRIVFFGGKILKEGKSGDTVVGTYSAEGVIVFKKQPDRRFELIEKPALPGFESWQVVEVAGSQATQ